MVLFAPPATPEHYDGHIPRNEHLYIKMHICGRWPSIREWADWWRTHRSWANSTNNTRIGHHTSEEVQIEKKSSALQLCKKRSWKVRSAAPAQAWMIWKNKQMKEKVRKRYLQVPERRQCHIFNSFYSLSSYEWQKDFVWSHVRKKRDQTASWCIQTSGWRKETRAYLGAYKQPGCKETAGTPMPHLHCWWFLHTCLQALLHEELLPQGMVMCSMLSATAGTGSALEKMAEGNRVPSAGYQTMRGIKWENTLSLSLQWSPITAKSKHQRNTLIQISVSTKCIASMLRNTKRLVNHYSPDLFPDYLCKKISVTEYNYGFYKPKKYQCFLHVSLGMTKKMEKQVRKEKKSLESINREVQSKERKGQGSSKTKP